jgi:hypothetical protein
MSDERLIVLPELHAAQRAVADHSARFKVLCAGRRWGKDVLEIDRIVHTVLEGKPAGWGSPTYKNLGDDWRELSSILGPITHKRNEQDKRIECYGGGVVEMWSLDSPDPIRGRKYAYWVINEAATAPYLMETWINIIRPTLVDYRGGALFGSTPKGLNDFHALYARGLDDGREWASFRYTSYDNPHIDPAELDAMRADMTDLAYRQEILAEFVASDSAVFRNLDAVCTAPEAKPEGHAGHVIVGGVDWGRDNDYTAVSLMCRTCNREVVIDRYTGVEYHQQLGRIEHLHKTWGVRRWRIELNSIGTPMFEELVRRGLPATGFTTTLQSKASLIDGFALAMERSDVLLLPSAAATAELRAYERTTTQTGISKYGAPPGMHDDTVIARALAYHALQEMPARDIGTIMRVGSEQWKKVRAML